MSNVQAATINQCADHCRLAKVLSVDTETTGLDFTKEKIVMLQIGTASTQFVIDTRFVDISPLKSTFEDKNILKILQNAKFDYKFLRNHDIILENIWDTMLADQIIHCGDMNIKHNLPAILKRYLNRDMSKDVRGQFSAGLKGAPFTDAQIHYGASDIVPLEEIMEKQQTIISNMKLKTIARLENEAALAFADIEYNGLILNVNEWMSLNAGIESKMHQLELELDNTIMNDPTFEQFNAKYIQGDLFGEPVRTVDVKWTSPKQVLAVMRKLIPKIESVNGKILYLHRNKHQLISTYIKYKEQAKIVSSYGEAFLQNLKSDGKVHTSFRQILNTGRVSSSEPNMQQIPSDNAFRNCFKAPKGWVFVSSDYSSQELNVIAYGSKDPVWLDALRFGQDLHSVCAELVYGEVWKNAAEEDCAYYADMKSGFILDWDTKTVDKHQKAKCECPEHKKLRTNVKTVNFGLAYGMGPNKLADTIEVSQKEAKELIEQYFDAFPAIGGFLIKLGMFGVKHGYTRTFPPFNRRRKFPDWYEGIERVPADSGITSTIERASKNTPIQGTSADMTKLALIYVRRRIKEYGLQDKVKLVMTVHDQIDTICEAKYATEWKGHLTQAMEDAALFVIKNGLLKADTQITDVWTK